MTTTEFGRRSILKGATSAAALMAAAQQLAKKV